MKIRPRAIRGPLLGAQRSKAEESRRGVVVVLHRCSLLVVECFVDLPARAFFILLFVPPKLSASKNIPETVQLRLRNFHLDGPSWTVVQSNWSNFPRLRRNQGVGLLLETSVARCEEQDDER